MNFSDKAREIIQIRTEDYWAERVNTGIDPLFRLIEKALREAYEQGREEQRKRDIELVGQYINTPLVNSGDLVDACRIVAHRIQDEILSAKGEENQ